MPKTWNTDAFAMISKLTNSRILIERKKINIDNIIKLSAASNWFE